MFFKSKEHDLLAVVSGETIRMEDVNDPVFSQKMMGDGFAINATGDCFYAPATGKITAIFPTKHAYGITTKDGLEILVHIGIDTVSENGCGLSCSYELNDDVNAGDCIIKMDRRYFEEKGYDLTTIVIFTNADTYKSFQCEYGKTVTGGKDIVAKYK